MHILSAAPPIAADRRQALLCAAPAPGVRGDLSGELVSVVIPARDAERTLARTLASASAQTHRTLEIVVVDDGSLDATAAIARAHAQADPRARLVSGGGDGVAAARNLAIAHASGGFIAPLDADDLWHPRKIELQLRAFARAPDEVALVYNYSRLINADDRVIGAKADPARGDVLLAHLERNFVSNGSTPLIRRAALPDPPYEPALRSAGNEGCEDYLMQLTIALQHRFECVPLFLTGYRKWAASMSGDAYQMMRSRVQALDLIAPHLPARARPVLRRKRAACLVKLSRYALLEGQRGLSARQLRAAFADHRAAAAAEAWALSQRAVQNRLAAPAAEPSAARAFADYAPEEGAAPGNRPAAECPAPGAPRPHG